MQSGLYHGFVGLVDGVLRKMIEEVGAATDGRRAPRVIATGGLASLIATGSEFIELVDDTLTLEGLRLVSRANSTGFGLELVAKRRLFREKQAFPEQRRLF